MFSALNQARGTANKKSSNKAKIEKKEHVETVKRVRLEAQGRPSLQIAKVTQKKQEKYTIQKTARKNIKPLKKSKVINLIEKKTEIPEQINQSSPGSFSSPVSPSASESDNDWEQNFERFSSSTPVPESSNGNLLGSRPVFNMTVDNFMTTNSKNVEEFILQHKKDYRSEFDFLEYSLELPIGKEKYLAATPIDNEDLNPLLETERIMNITAQYFVPAKLSRTIKDPQMRDCIVRRFKRAVREKNSKKLKETIEEFNDLVKKLKTNDQIVKQIKMLPAVPPGLVTEILDQVYSRIVSPCSKQLRAYEAFSDNVYGELLPKFVRQIFNDAHLLPEHAFVDLGSGVGNCVLQASLEIGCESWGCEVMEIAGRLANEQQHEFQERTKAYGLSHGPLHFIQKNFLESPEIKAVLANADTVLVNNYAFSASLNSDLINLFLDLKNGCKIISLKSFVPPGHVISAHNIESPINILKVEKKQFGSNSVSWTDAGGDYFISIVDRSRLSKYR